MLKTNDRRLERLSDSLDAKSPVFDCFRGYFKPLNGGSLLTEGDRMGKLKKRLFGFLDIVGDALLEESRKVKAPEIKMPKILESKTNDNTAK